MLAATVGLLGARPQNGPLAQPHIAVVGDMALAMAVSFSELNGILSAVCSPRAVDLLGDLNADINSSPHFLWRNAPKYCNQRGFMNGLTVARSKTRAVPSFSERFRKVTWFFTLQCFPTSILGCLNYNYTFEFTT